VRTDLAPPIAVAAQAGTEQTRLTRERRAEVPLLSRLPLISFFFKQEGAADENRSLMVMVRAWITDIRETEGK
jgi:type II secretory pathway component GspD/PulD (secretin)